MRRQGVSPARGSSSALHVACRRRRLLQESARRHVNQAAKRSGRREQPPRPPPLQPQRSGDFPPCSGERPGRLRPTDLSAAALSQRVTSPLPPLPLLSLPSWLEIPTDVSRAREKRRPPRKGGEAAHERGAPKAEQLPGCLRGQRVARAFAAAGPCSETRCGEDSSWGRFKKKTKNRQRYC